MNYSYGPARAGFAKGDHSYIRSPLGQQVEFASGPPSVADSEEERDNVITFQNNVKTGAYVSSHQVPPYSVAWVERPPPSSSRPAYKRHRRISTAELIALAAKPFLTPRRILCLFAIVCGASYLARLLPMLVAPVWKDPVYNPNAVHRPPAIFESLAFDPSALRDMPGPRGRARLDNGARGVPLKPAAREPARRRQQVVQPAQRKEPAPLRQGLDHKQRLQVVVYDGVERAQHADVEELERIEAGLLEADREDNADNFERIVIDLADEEDERASAEEWLEAEFSEDENEDVPPDELDDGEEAEDAQRLPLPMRFGRGRPISEYLARAREEDERETLFQR